MAAHLLKLITSASYEWTYYLVISLSKKHGDGERGRRSWQGKDRPSPGMQQTQMERNFAERGLPLSLGQGNMFRQAVGLQDIELHIMTS